MAGRSKRSVTTGSVLLGRELRRLRGARTLDEIATLTKAPPHDGHVQVLSASTLSDIELGRQLPRLTTLHALSVVYRVSMNQLMGYVLEEKLLDERRVPAVGTRDDSRAAFSRLLSLERWHEALAVAAQNEQAADTDESRVSWRANRAACLARMGLHVEAMGMLTACLESDACTTRQRAIILHTMADIHASAGHYQTAGMYVAEAVARLPEDAPASEQAALLELRSGLLIDVQEAQSRVNEPSLREALRVADDAARLWGDDAPAQLRVRCLKARATCLLGNRPVAARDYERILEDARSLPHPGVEASAAIELARLRREAGQPAAAETLLVRAASLAEAGQHYDLLFDASFELFRLLRDDRPGTAVRHLHRCQRLAPYLPAHSPMLRQYEQAVKEVAS